MEPQISSNEMERVIEEGPWLQSVNHKTDLIKKGISLKRQVGNEVYRKCLNIYEARESYLNQMQIEDLENLIQDLEKAAISTNGNL